MKITNDTEYMMAIAQAMYHQDEDALQEVYEASQHLGGTDEEQEARAHLMEVADAMIDLVNKTYQ